MTLAAAHHDIATDLVAGSSSQPGAADQYPDHQHERSW